MKKSSKKNRHWSYEQNLWYYFSLILLYPVSKRGKFYKKMMMFVVKNNQQCRTHHQKMLQPFKKNDIADKEKLYKQNIYKFYQQNYVLRRKDQAHLKHQLQNFLNDLMNNPSYQQNRKEYQNCLKLIDQILAQLQLQSHCNKKNKIEKETSSKIQEIQEYFSLDKDQSF